MVEELKERIEKIPVKKVNLPVAHEYPDYMESKDFISKQMVLQIIDELNE